MFPLNHQNKLIWTKKFKLIPIKNSIPDRLDYFKAMFTNDTREARDNCVKFDDMTFLELQTFVRVIYCNKLVDWDKFSVPLLFKADMYNMKDFQKNCEYHICRNICKENVVETLMMTHKFDFISPVVKESCKKYLLK